MLKNSIKRFGERPALSFVSGEPISYNEANKQIEQLQQVLYRLGINHGDKVAIYSHSVPHWGIAYFAIVTMGAIAVPLLPDFTDKEVKSCLEHSETTMIIASEKLMSRIPETVSVKPYPITYGNLASLKNSSTVVSVFEPPNPKNFRCPPNVFFSCFPARRLRSFLPSLV